MHSDPPLPRRDEIENILDFVEMQVREYIGSVDDRPVLSADAVQATRAFTGSLPEEGAGAEAAVAELAKKGLGATVTTQGPRCFHFVIGGVTPAALGADLLTAALDQPAYTWISSPLGVTLEILAMKWLGELFELPAELTGVMTTGATMANFVGLGAARQWWGERHGVDISEAGMSELPAMPILSSGYIHASTRKCCSMLGLGRAAVQTFSRDAAGRLDAGAMEHALQALDGTPAVIVANAGEVNAGGFDPIDEMADLAERYDAWLHVDGAFGLFARVAPRAAHLARGAERANSICVDGHKWLNVPYDCGFAFVRDPDNLLGRTFAYDADYLPKRDDPRPTPGAIGPESSRRARALAVWATLRAYGRAGYRNLVEQHLSLAQLMGRLVDDAPELERLAEVQLNIVCFRYNPGGLGQDALDALNTRLGAAILDDGRVFAGTTRFEGRVALRPALVNWRTRESDVETFIGVVRELAATLQ